MIQLDYGIQFINTINNEEIYLVAKLSKTQIIVEALIIQIEYGN